MQMDPDLFDFGVMNVTASVRHILVSCDNWINFQFAIFMFIFVSQ